MGLAAHSFEWAAVPPEMHFQNRSPHREPQVQCGSQCGMPLGLMAPAHISNFLSGWLQLREQLRTRNGNHQHRCEPKT
ncbi:hypothetical protein AB205_0047330 [Aquarana catesbeiana]|uniref:Uncharacterized protein n=1 Tax=Aquarana catesbeiana TaxID=8400 RepID=A0A2G9RSR5_AQUCT|nr:hypothetical protein AB205_0047330 [Aquarana catesbeiana]